MRRLAQIEWIWGAALQTSLFCLHFRPWLAQLFAFEENVGVPRCQNNLLDCLALYDRLEKPWLSDWVAYISISWNVHLWQSLNRCNMRNFNHRSGHITLTFHFSPEFILLDAAPRRQNRQVRLCLIIRYFECLFFLDTEHEIRCKNLRLLSVVRILPITDEWAPLNSRNQTVSAVWAQVVRRRHDLWLFDLVPHEVTELPLLVDKWYKMICFGAWRFDFCQSRRLLLSY